VVRNVDSTAAEVCSMSRPATRSAEMADYIRKHPGQTRKQIAAGMGKSLDSVIQCTKHLAAQMRIRSEGDGKASIEKRWFAKDAVSNATKMGHAPMFRRVSSIFEVRP